VLGVDVKDGQHGAPIVCKLKRGLLQIGHTA